MDKQGCPKEGDRYVNPHIDDIKRRLIDVVFWKTGHYDDQVGWQAAPANFTYPCPEEVIDDAAPKVTWINHNTFLISVDGINILTDPVFSKRCSPLFFAGPKRKHRPGLELEELLRIDYVLISHNHYDHLDRYSVKQLKKLFPNILWLVPTGVKKWFLHRGIKNVVELGWWEDKTIDSEEHPGVDLKITAVPTQHCSGRHSFNLNKTLWVGWVVEFERLGKEKKQLYYVGDTGYNPLDFKKIGEHFGSMDLSLIPIGTYVPRIFMSPVHIEPDHSVLIHKEVRSKLSVGMHWKTFNLSDEPLNQPPYDLFLSLTKQNVDPLTFRVLEPGYEINW